MATPLERAQSCLTEASHLLLAPTPDRLDQCAVLFADATEFLRQVRPEHRTRPEVDAFLGAWREANEAFNRAGTVVDKRLRSAPSARYGASGLPAVRLAAAGQELARY